MNAANIGSSNRLLRVNRLLADFAPHTTMEIIAKCNVCAVNSIISELRANGVKIDCKRINKTTWQYTRRE